MQRVWTVIRPIAFTLVAITSNGVFLAYPLLVADNVEPSLWIRLPLQVLILPAYLTRLFFTLVELRFLGSGASLGGWTISALLLPMLPFLAVDAARAYLRRRFEHTWRTRMVEVQNRLPEC